MSVATSTPDVWTLLKVLQWTQGRFAERGLGSPRLDAEVLLGHVLKYDRTRLYMHFDQPLLPDELAAYKELIKRRLGGEPVAYLVGKKEFRSLELTVSPAVLIPRPDTETLVEVALEWAKSHSCTRIVDVGTGSGAVALAVRKVIFEAEIIAVDRSAEAAAVAQQNSAQLELTIDVRVGDLLAPVEGPIELVLANLPYIPSGEIAGLAVEVRREPHAALDGGPDGLDLVRRLIGEAVAKLAPGGGLFLEIGAGQAEATAALLTGAGFVDVAGTKDLGGIVRVVGGSRPASATTSGS